MNECDDESGIGNATAKVSLISYIDMYTELQHIKFAEDIDKELDFALKTCETKLGICGIDPDYLKYQ